jgi:monoamine oxidase
VNDSRYPTQVSLDKSQASKSGGNVRIAILGGGISGLVSAYELKKMGFGCTVFERSERVGGRIQTYTFPGTNHIGELGAMRIPGGHLNTLRLISAMGLDKQLSRFTTIFQNEKCVIDLRSFSEIPSQFPHSGPAESTLVDNIIKVVIWKLKVVIDSISPREIRELFDSYLSNTLYSDLAHLINTRVDPLQFWFILNASVEELVEFFANLSQQMAPSLRMFFGDISLEVSKDLFLIKGGMQQLPDRLFEEVSEQFRFKSEIRSISNEENHVEIEIFDRELGTLRREKFDYLICTIPVPVLQNMTLKGFTQRKMDAIRQARYASTSKVLFLCKRKFWKHSPYEIDAGASYIGDFVRQIYYTDSKIDDGTADSERGVLLASYSIGKDAEEMADLPDQQLIAMVKASIARIHPEIDEPGMIENVKIHHWQQEAGYLGGCSVAWPIYYKETSTEEDVYRVWDAIAQPEKRVFFAGEHCSDERAWIEGGVTSSLRAVESMLQRIKCL